VPTAPVGCLTAAAPDGGARRAKLIQNDVKTAAAGEPHAVKRYLGVRLIFGTIGKNRWTHKRLEMFK
jgi:hypothetical protein